MTKNTFADSANRFILCIGYQCGQKLPAIAAKGCMLHGAATKDRNRETLAILITRLLFVLAIVAFAGHAQSAATVRSGASADAAGLTPTRDQFRVDLGGGTTAGANGSYGSLRREINWDGVPASFAAPNVLPPNFFNLNSPRGVVLTTPGTGFQVSGASSDAGAGQPAAAYFGNLNATYPATFQVFSAQRLFTSLASNVFDVSFYVPGTSVPARVSGFGCVLADVDQSNTTSLTFFDRDGVSLGSFFVPAFSSGLSFLGVSFSDTSPSVARVRVTLGNATIGPTDNSTTSDIVVADDFIYGEPTDRIFGNGFD